MALQIKEELPPLRTRVDELLDYITQNATYLQYNADIFTIYSGNLLPFVLDIMRNTLSANYFERIKERAVPINVLKRLIDKLSRVYASDPIRTSENTKYQDWMHDYEKIMDINANYNIADEFANMFKGYALEPFLDENDERKLRVIPFDRFLVKSNSLINDTEMDTFIKFIGQRLVRVKDDKEERFEQRDIYFSYTKDEFWAFDSQGDPYNPANIQTEGINPFGIIPFSYGNRSRHKLLPVQDTDLIPLTTLIPVMLSDIGGAIMFQCFTIMYGIDVDAENLTMSPNAFWTIKSDPSSKHQPQVGTLTPKVDSDKVRNYIRDVFVFWLETRGVKVGAMGNMSGENLASGFAKAMDEMDTFETRKVNVQFFRAEEPDFWEKLRIMHNYWVQNNFIQGDIIGDDFLMNVEHDKPTPNEDREKTVRTVKLERDSAFLDQRSAIKRLYPDLSEGEIDQRILDVLKTFTVKEEVEDATPGTKEKEEEEEEE